MRPFRIDGVGLAENCLFTRKGKFVEMHPIYSFQYEFFSGERGYAENVQDDLNTKLI